MEENNNQNIETPVEETKKEETTGNEVSYVLKKQKSNNGFLIFLGILIVLACAVAVYYFVFSDKANTHKEKPGQKNEIQLIKPLNAADYALEGNGLENFDIVFMKALNEKKNVVYSPLSIKYALLMLNDATTGDTNKEISTLVGKYNPKTYINSANMSFANAMFVRDSYKNNIKEDYLTTLQTKYTAEIIYDKFEKADAMNNWISDKTFKLLDNMLSDSDVTNLDFALVNALAIDMEWTNKLSSSLSVSFAHENYDNYVGDVEINGYKNLEFGENKDNVAAIDFLAVANKYDIIKSLGEDEIRSTVGKEFDEYFADEENATELKEIGSKEAYLDQYIKDIKANYGYNKSSTDFKYLVNDDVKVFAKNLKVYGNTELEYVAIMPVKNSLENYVETMNANSLNKIIDDLKDLKFETFTNGVLTEVKGSVPMFNYKYDLPLMDVLNALGVKKVFTKGEAEMGNLTSDDAYISTAKHSANIELSNEGIKASAATMFGGMGATGFGFEYKFDIPQEKIDLTFNNPYLYIIRDTKTGEVWFTGTVYEPCDYETYEKEHTAILEY